MKKIYWITLIIIALVLILVFTQKNAGETNPDTANYEAFSECLAATGAKFYGAFWCPHCQDQKEILRGALSMPYIECSTPNGEEQNQICIDENITSYPTWKFADGTTANGKQQVSVLANKTNCPLP